MSLIFAFYKNPWNISLLAGNFAGSILHFLPSETAASSGGAGHTLRHCRAFLVSRGFTHFAARLLGVLCQPH
jgi:hypothetical protein